MNRATMVGLGCGGFFLAACAAAFLGWWSSVHGMQMTGDAEEVRSRSDSLLRFTPPAELEPFFARVMQRDGSEPAVVWAVDSRYQRLMLVLRAAAAEPPSMDDLVTQLTLVHPGLAGFDALPGAQRVPVRVLGQERTALVQEAKTVDESRQARSCLAFPYGKRWVLLLLQGDGRDADAAALQKLLDGVLPPLAE